MPEATRNERLYLVAYDIVSDRRRARVARRLADVGQRVNYSVFEVWSVPPALEQLLVDVRRLMDQKTDHVRVYTLCRRCQGDVRVIGPSHRGATGPLEEV